MKSRAPRCRDSISLMSVPGLLESDLAALLRDREARRRAAQRRSDSKRLIMDS